MGNLPKDPMMLYSVVNTKLRDYYLSLDAMCEDMEIDKEALLEKLAQVGFAYHPELNKFI